MTARGIRVAVVISCVWATEAAPRAYSQVNSDLESFFHQKIGLDQQEIQRMRTGEPVVKALPPRTPAEVFLFGAVFVKAAPEKYLEFARDFERRRKLPDYLALGICGNPAQLADWNDFSLEGDDVQALKKCRPGDCLIQLPATSIEDLDRLVNWAAPDPNEQVNRLLHEGANRALRNYQQQGTAALGAYHDKNNPVDVAQQFAYMLSYADALPAQLPDFYRYLLDYPKAKPANIEDTFYWAKVKFGLKPTLRVVHVLTMRGSPADQIAYVIGEKQLYASHYFETALDLSFCIRSLDSNRPGFYLVMTMGSEQAGLTGPKGSIVRKAAVGRSLSNLRNALSTVKLTLEN